MAEDKLVLKPGVVIPFLSNFQMSNDGESFHFTELHMQGKNIEQLNKTIEEAKEVYICNLSMNNIADPGPLKELQNLIHLDLQKNKIKNVSVFTLEEVFQNLKYLDLSNNKFTELAAFKLPKLEYLDISYNKLEKINEGWQGHQKIKIFKSIDNKFKNLAPFKNMPKLEELYASNNMISTLIGGEGLVSLKKLHLRHNKIDKIEEEGVPEFPSLQYINLRTNKLSTMDDVYRLFNMPQISDINVINNPCELSFSSMNIMIGQVLQKNPKIKRFCKVAITDAHRLEAVYLGKFIWLKSEEERKKKEEEERKKAEADEGAG